MARLKEKYFKEIVPGLKDEFGYRNVMEVPRVTKVTLNMGVGEAKTNAKLLDEAVEELALITGQRPAITKARKSIADFKLREGMSIGCRVTLRGERMYEMIDRLGQDIPRGEGGTETALQDAGVQPLPALWPPARLLPQVRALPHLSARSRAPGRHPRSDQVELVRRRGLCQ